MGSTVQTLNQGKEPSLAQVKRTRLIYLCIGALSLLALGLVYAWSIFAVPLGDAFGWDRSMLAHVFSISMAAFCIGALIGSFLVKWKSIRFALIIAAILQLAGFVLTSQMAAQGIWSLYLFYGVFAGLGCGIGYNIIISTTNLWFPDRVGLASGVLMMGFGLGSLILGTVANAAIGTFGWSITFVVIGIVSACILIMLSLVLRFPPTGIENIVGGPKAKKKNVAMPIEQKPLLKTSMFYLYFIWAVLVFAAVMTLVGDSKQGALALGVDPASATLLVGLVSMMNGVARVVIGMIYDRTSLRVAMTLTMGAGLLAVCSLTAAFALHIPQLYFAAAIIMGFTGGGIPVMASSFTRERFGAASYPQNLATVNFSVAGSALISSLVVAIGRPLGGDVAVYAILVALLVIALIDVVIFFRVYYKRSV